MLWNSPLPPPRTPVLHHMLHSLGTTGPQLLQGERVIFSRHPRPTRHSRPSTFFPIGLHFALGCPRLWECGEDITRERPGGHLGVFSETPGLSFSGRALVRTRSGAFWVEELHTGAPVRYCTPPPMPSRPLVPSCDSAGVLGFPQPSLKVPYVRGARLYRDFMTLELASGKRKWEEGWRVQLWGDFEVDTFPDS